MIVARWNGLLSLVCALAIAISAGCGGPESAPALIDSQATSTGDSEAATARQTPIKSQRYETPDATVQHFLNCLKSGDHERSTTMLTVKAQQEMAKLEATIQPPGSHSAEFKVTEVELLGDQQDSAHVLSTWTDTDEQGATATHEIVWILRREPTGWAIAGFATSVFEDEPPLILNFEDPLDLQRKRAAVDAEIARRDESQNVR